MERVRVHSFFRFKCYVTIRRLLHFKRRVYNKKWWMNELLCRLSIFEKKSWFFSKNLAFFENNRFSIDDLIINFCRITFVHGAKRIYFSRRIRIRKQNVDSITSARAMRARKQQKTQKFAFLVGRPEISASLARAGQKIFQIQILRKK